jgi:hypothetical protein
LCLSHIKSEHIYDGDRPEMDGRLRPAVSAARDIGASSFNDNAVQVTFAILPMTPHSNRISKRNLFGVRTTRGSRPRLRRLA